MGLWEFANHILTITVMGTTVRLVAPTVPTEPGASDPMAARSFTGHISSKNPDGAWWQEPQVEERPYRISGRVVSLYLHRPLFNSNILDT